MLLVESSLFGANTRERPENRVLRCVLLHKLLSHSKSNLFKDLSSQRKVIFGGASHLHHYVHHFYVEELQAGGVHLSLEYIHDEGGVDPIGVQTRLAHNPPENGSKSLSYLIVDQILGGRRIV